MQTLRNGVYTLALEFFCISLLQICCKLNILSARKDYQWLPIVFFVICQDTIRLIQIGGFLLMLICLFQFCEYRL